MSNPMLSTTSSPGHASDTGTTRPAQSRVQLAIPALNTNSKFAPGTERIVVTI